jgi:glucosamine-6-phosphate deaminase
LKEATLTDQYQKLSLAAAEAVIRQLKGKPDSCIGLPTGRTPIGCYAILSDLSKGKKLDWSAAKCFALDDYLDADEDKSFNHYLYTHLYKQCNLPITSRFNPRFSDDYDALIAGQGGLDLTLIGIGRNGHIAFNEPQTPFSSWTHCLRLTESTRRANSAFFGSVEKTPQYAATMGIKTILSSRKLILIANGSDKQEILHKALHGPITEDVPASILQQHPDLSVITDFDY